MFRLYILIIVTMYGKPNNVMIVECVVRSQCYDCRMSGKPNNVIENVTLLQCAVRVTMLLRMCGLTIFSNLTMFRVYILIIVTMSSNVDNVILRI